MIAVGVARDQALPAPNEGAVARAAAGGICAVASFGGDEAPDGLERMAGGARWRCAGGIASASDGGVGLAALATGASGMPAARGLASAHDLLVAADARLVRRPEWLAELIPHLSDVGAGRGPTDAALILAAYRKWGRDCADHLLGEFAFVVWDRQRRTILAARDPVGARPLRYSWDASRRRARLASSAWQILAAGDVSHALDGVALGDFLGGHFHDPTRTPFAAIRNVPPGSCMELGSDGARTWRYWNPERAGVDAPGDERGWVEAFRERLLEVVADHLDGSGTRAALMTSGGLDSSSIAAIARLLERQGAIDVEPIALVHVFDRLRSCDEWRWASSLGEETGIEMETMVSDDLAHLPTSGASAEPGDSPMTAPSELVEHVLERARERGCSIVTTGYGGDTLFDGARWQHADLVRSGRWTAAWPWVAGARARGASWPRAMAAIYLLPLLGSSGRRRLDRVRGGGRYWRAPPWLAPEVRERVEARRNDRSLPRRFESRARQEQYEHLVGLAQQGPAIDAWSEQAARHGMEARFPLLDRRLAELVLAMPLSLGARPGPAGSKWALREATAGVLPERIRTRPGKGSWAELTRDVVCRRWRDDFREAFSGSRLARLGLVDDGALLAALETTCDADGGLRYHPTLLAAALAVERWLRSPNLGGGEIRFPEHEPCR